MRPGDVVELVGLAAIWGASFLFMRIAVPEFGPVALILMRVLVAALLLAPVLAVRGGLASLRRDVAALVFVGIVNSALPFLLFAWALLSVSAALGSVLNSTAPMFAALVARLWFGERLTPGRWLGLFVGSLGVLVLVQDRLAPASGVAAPPARAALAIAACLLAAFCYGVAANYTKRRLAGTDAMTVAAGSQGWAAVVLLAPAVVAWPVAPPSPLAWLAVLALGGACTGIAYVMYFRLIGNVGPSRAISVTFLVPVFGVLFGVVFLGENVTASMLAGSVVVLVGTAMSTGLVDPLRWLPFRADPPS